MDSFLKRFTFMRETFTDKELVRLQIIFFSIQFLLNVYLYYVSNFLSYNIFYYRIIQIILNQLLRIEQQLLSAYQLLSENIKGER